MPSTHLCRSATIFAALASLPAHALAQSTSTPGAPVEQPAVRAPEPEPQSSSAPTGSEPRPTGMTARVRGSADAEGTLIRLVLPGEFQMRANALSSIPLATAPGATGPNTLGQTSYLELWFRFTPQLSYGDHLRLVSQFDVARGILLGDSTQQVELSRDSRSTELTAFPHGAFDLRWLYLEWDSPVGVLRIGQQGSHWGLGIVANDGNHAPIFGDYRLGDIVERIAFATRPFGRESDLVAAVAGDLVYRDRLASLVQYQVPFDETDAPSPDVTRTLGGDIALQGVLSVFYQDHACHADCEKKRVGVYLAYRNQHSPGGDYLDVGIADFYAAWQWPTPDGRSDLFAGVEAAGIFGATNMARDALHDQHQVLQFGGAMRLGLEHAQRFRVTFEAGYASGDSNPYDDTQRRFTFNPDYRVGLILFPEVINWSTARAASIALDPRVAAHGAHGAQLLPSSGGVTNAAYIYPTAIVNLTQWLDVRAGAVVGVATSDWVDPVQYQLLGSPRNYRGGDARARDLGVELDLGVMGRVPLSEGIGLTAGVQGAVFFPGHAFDSGDPDPATRGMGTLALVQGRLGLAF